MAAPSPRKKKELIMNARTHNTGFQVEQLEGRRLCSASPAVSIADVSQGEGQDGTTAFVFSVSLSRASTKAVSVQYATADDSAAAGSDYNAVTGTLTFAAGEKIKTVTVLVNGDSAVESDERFFLNLSSASNAVLRDAQGAGTIMNYDSAPIYIDPTYGQTADDTQTEENNGTDYWDSGTWY
jgi:hypothetical protein